MREMRNLSKLTSLTALALIFASGSAFAGAGEMSSGRPSAVLTPEQCADVWKRAVPSGDSLAQANASSFVANFAQADANQDGMLSKQEFEAGCGKGLIKNPGNQ
jgi:hypothetical protein